MAEKEPNEKTSLLNPEFEASCPTKLDDGRKVGGGKASTACGRLCAWMGSTYFLLYCSHALSAWGDRMWQFATGMFLVALNPNSLRLTAIYGFASGGSIILFGALVGNWVDKYPRINVARVALVTQNLCVCVSASIVCLTIYFEDDIRSTWAGLETVCHVFIILFAVVADVASIGRQISIERDWIVVICRDTDTLTSMSAFLRRINLTAQLLAPVVTGQIITYGSMTIGAIFIAGWNLVSVFVEYFFLRAVYRSEPELADKGKKPAAVSTEEESCEPLDKSGMPDQADTEVVIKHNASYEKTNSGVGDLDNVVVSGDLDDGARKKKHSAPVEMCLLLFDSFVTLRRGWKTYINQTIVCAGLGLSCLYMTVIGFDNVTSGYAKEQGLSESLLGVLMGCGALVGILGTVAFPKVRRCVGLERTGLIALGIQLACLLVCVISIFVPGSPFDPGSLGRAHLEEPVGPHCEPDMADPVPMMAFADDFSAMYRPLPASHIKQMMPRSMAIAVAPSVNCTLVNEGATAEPTSYLSITLLMAGIVFSRFGLWMADLTVTQLLLETPADHERGIVNGVQNSLNSLMDLLKFVLVIVLPWPETFGILVLLSFVFVVIGAILYATYSRKVRGHLFHFGTYHEDLLRFRFQNPESRLYVPLTT